MLTCLSIHAPMVAASAGATQSAPLEIKTGLFGCDAPHLIAQSEVTFFMEDHALAKKLADAINKTIAEHRAEIAAPRLVAAE